LGVAEGGAGKWAAYIENDMERNSREEMWEETGLIATYSVSAADFPRLDFDGRLDGLTG
jgi:hypothetical protein